MDIKQFNIIMPYGGDGPFTIHIPLHAMTGYVVPRDHITEAGTIDGIFRQGIYFLVGNDKIYVGQTRNGLTRIQQHLLAKDWWEKAFLFLATGTEFDLDTISGLEKIGIERAFKDSPYQVMNKDMPNYEARTPYSKLLIETCYQEIETVLNVFGIKTKGKVLDSTALSVADDSNTEYSLMKFMAEIWLTKDGMLNKDRLIALKSNRQSDRELYHSYCVWLKSGNKNEPEEKDFRVELKMVIGDYHRGSRCAHSPVAGKSWIHNGETITEPEIARYIHVLEPDKIDTILKPYISDESSLDVKKQKRGRFHFSMCNIPVGSELEYIRDPSIKVEVVDDIHVSYKGEITTLSNIVKRLQNVQTIQGTLWFSYKGKVINDLRLENESES